MEVKKVGQVLRAINSVRETTGYAEMPSQMLAVLLHVAVSKEIGQDTLQNDLGLTQASCSRLLSRLSVGRPSDPGLGLVESFEDPEWRRRKIVRILPKGLKVVEQMVEDMR